MRDIKELPEVLTAGEVANYLRISKTTVCRWCNNGKLPAFRIGRGWRIQRGDLEQYIRLAMTEPELPHDHLRNTIMSDHTNSDNTRVLPKSREET